MDAKNQMWIQSETWDEKTTCGWKIKYGWVKGKRVDEKLEVNEKTPNLDERNPMGMKKSKCGWSRRRRWRRKKKMLPLLLGHGDGVVMPSSGLSLDQCLLGSSSERSQLQQLRDQLLQYWTQRAVCELRRRLRVFQWRF